MKFEYNGVRNFGISKLRGLSATRLRELNKTATICIIRDYSEPISVLIPYAYYLKLQEMVHKAKACLMEEGFE